ncbi:catalase family peroxidase [Falsiroseomonas tokyonensis]|uniref:Catalase-related peroxidase n=1 Tax=Falsiroseomonas tokyonensis TaxID=430521 RepID=A0ABV7C079_9PROT|nr:catalase family peroxidase [Falsiroseomonas tokyonensis]MBU8541194.1 catalase family peroxidase [Falsiroseomonas tokyonensis]
MKASLQRVAPAACAFMALLGTALAVSPQARAEPPSAEAIIEAFEGVLGPIRTSRPSHAKGTCAAGHFVATPEGARFSVAPVFNGQRVPTIIRFGVGVGNPAGPDTGRTTRSLSIRFETQAGDIWDMANISAPIFGAPTPEAMVAGLVARRPDPATGQPDPQKVAAFLAANPATTLQARWLAATLPPASWATTPYWGVNAFRFRGADGEVRHVRWVFEPRAGVQRLTEEEMRTRPANFLADELRGRVAAAPVEFDMVLQFAGPGDDLVNPTIAWPDDRPRAVVGRLTVTEVAPGPGGACDPISFLTLDLAPGVEYSDDPTLHARTGTYAVSLSRRLQ